jgi:uncharacterized membrane protein (DUF485 family)
VDKSINICKKENEKVREDNPTDVQNIIHTMESIKETRDQLRRKGVLFLVLTIILGFVYISYLYILAILPESHDFRQWLGEGVQGEINLLLFIILMTFYMISNFYLVKSVKAKKNLEILQIKNSETYEKPISTNGEDRN